jgi:hypothetical protein
MKILFLAVSMILIAGAAGIAMAKADIQLSSLDVAISPTAAVADNFNIVLSQTAETGTYTLKVDPQVPGILVYVIPDPNQPFNLIPTIGGTTNWITSTSSDSSKIGTMSITSIPFTYKGKIFLSGNAAGDVLMTLSLNGVTVDQKALKTSPTVSANVPEFPTLALPIAAVLGLIFVFGRNRGDL